MPIYMDRHDIPGVTAEAVAEAHQADLKIQDKFDCKGLTYWFDEEKGMAFCLIEAPSKDSVQELHDYAHGLIPNKVIEVEPNIVEAFLGRIKDPTGQDHAISVITDPAFRCIMAIYLDNDTRIASKFENNDTPFSITKTFHKIVRDNLDQFQGREVEQSSECLMASFSMVKQSLLCAISIQEQFEKLNAKNPETKNISVGIGLSAGVPVAEDEILFGDSVKLARRLRYIANAGQVVMGTTVHDLCEARKFSSEENTDVMALTPPEESFLSTVMDIMDDMECNPNFNVKTFARQAGMSKAQFYRNMTSIIGHSPTEFIQLFRLEKALDLIEKRKGNISEIAYESGFNSLSYFSKCFQKHYEVLPSDYANKIA